MTGTPRSIVAHEIVTGDVQAAVERALDAAEWQRALPEGAQVALKVNLGWDLFIPGSITSPLVAEAVIHALRRRVGSIVMVEADQVLEDVESAFHASGMAAVCTRTGVPWVNLSREPTDVVETPGNVVLKTIRLPRILRERLLVTLPVMKTHAKTGISGALKNQWGCLEKMRHEYHLWLDDAIPDINAVVRPVLAIMDGTVALEGNGPKSGWPVVADRILCSRDPVALDAVQAVLMGLDPGRLGHLVRAAERGLGEWRPERIEVRGPDPQASRLAIKVAHHNAVSAVENLLRGSFLKRLVFNTPFFRLCLFGAKTYYRMWTFFRAEQAWRSVESHPVYGPQWRGVRPRGGRAPSP